MADTSHPSSRGSIGGRVPQGAVVVPMWQIGLVLLVGLVAGYLMGLNKGRAQGQMMGASSNLQDINDPHAGLDMEGNQLPSLTPEESSRLSGMIDSTDDYDTLVNMGNDHYDVARRELAIKAYEKALRVKPGDPDVLTDLGRMYFQLGRYDEAQDRYEKALQSDPNHAITNYLMGLLMVEARDDLDKAIEYLEKCISLAPDDPVAGAARAQIERIKGSNP